MTNPELEGMKPGRGSDAARTSERTWRMSTSATSWTTYTALENALYEVGDIAKAESEWVSKGTLGGAWQMFGGGGILTPVGRGLMAAMKEGAAIRDEPVYRRPGRG